VKHALVLLVASGIACENVQAQRTAENAVTQAEDAFGTSIGRETIGLYGASSVRGFSPTRAGNVRIDGLAFDQVWGLIPRLSDQNRCANVRRPSDMMRHCWLVRRFQAKQQ
jgi:hypothetical protein